MTSKLKTTSNKKNARRSTGPRTTSGKVKSALNAIKHGLSSQHTFDEPTCNKINRLAQAFAAGDTCDHRILTLAREAAEAQVMVERAAEARRHAWREAECDWTIIKRGKFHSLNDPASAQHFTETIGQSLSLSELKKSMPPSHFAPPFENYTEKTVEVLRIASKKLTMLIRYERQLAKRRDKALRELEKCR